MELPKYGAMTRLATISRASSTPPLTKTISSRMVEPPWGLGDPGLPYSRYYGLLCGDPDLAVRVVHERGAAFAQFAGQHRLGQLVLDLALDQPPQRPRAEVGVVAFPRQVRLRRVGDVQRNLRPGQPLLQLSHLQARSEE